MNINMKLPKPDAAVGGLLRIPAPVQAQPAVETATETLKQMKTAAAAGMNIAKALEKPLLFE